VGLRPTWGRVSRHGLRPGMWSMDTIGPLARTVEDCALTLQAIAGHDPHDAYTWDVPVPDYRAALDGNLAGTRVGVVKELLYADVVEPEVRDAVSQAVHVLAALGAQVDEVSIPLTSHANTISSVLRVEAPTNYRELIRERLQEIKHDNRIAYLTWSLTPALAYYKALKLRALLRQEVLAALEHVDVLVMPTMGSAAPKIEPDPIIDSKERSTRNRAGLTTAFSLASAPALSLCCGFTAEHLPIGLQIGGKPFAEQTVLNVAYAYQHATDWHGRRPPL
jgi:aspartyl-tRNA(Asn)/glutamyl-tRNA(Gln) amidotransferase subunit A